MNENCNNRLDLSKIGIKFHSKWCELISAYQPLHTWCEYKTPSDSRKMKSTWWWWRNWGDKEKAINRFQFHIILLFVYFLGHIEIHTATHSQILNQKITQFQAGPKKSIRLSIFASNLLNCNESRMECEFINIRECWYADDKEQQTEQVKWESRMKDIE